MPDLMLDALVDSLKILPFLFLTYLLMEYIEYNAMGKLTKAIGKFRRSGPLFGGIVGIIPQCGFSAAASGLFSGGVISIGTLIAVFFSTSDEMLPLFISYGVAADRIISIVIVKIIISIVTGFAIDGMLAALKKKRIKSIHDFCEDEHCDCEDGIFKSALIHTIKIWIFVLIVNICLNILLSSTGFMNMSQFIGNRAWLAVPIVCLIGLIPNCASSIVITECYLNGIISSGAMMAGLLVSCGVGLLVLYRSNHSLKENVTITAAMYVMGIFWGFVIEFFGIAF